MTKRTYIIYHAIGLKVGCTVDLQARSAENRSKFGEDLEIVVLETFVGTEQEAGDREWHWADKFGYTRGPHYTLALEQRRRSGRRGAASPRHNTNDEEHQKKWRHASHISPNSITRRLVTCPHCGRVGTQFPMARWHFDRCREKVPA